MLIGLIGKAQSGKSTIAKHLVEEYGFTRYAFADPLKEMLLKAGMCTKEELWGHKTEQTRWLLQKIGTDIFRKQVDPEFWGKKALYAISILKDKEYRNVVVDDIRFPGEAEIIKTLGGTTVRVERANHTDKHAGETHDTERFVSEIPFDYPIVAQSGDIETLTHGIELIIKIDCRLKRRQTRRP